MRAFEHMSSPLRILLVDDDPFTLTMLSTALSSLGFTEVTSAQSASAAIALAQHVQPQTVVVDLDLGEGPTGIDLAHRLRKLFPNIGVVVLSTYVEPRLIGTQQQSMPAGSIYVVKQTISNLDTLRNAIVKSVETSSSPDVQITEPSPIAHLGDSQVEIMRLIAGGMSNAQIAEKLIMQEASVEKAIARLIKQLGVQATREQNQRVLIAQQYHQLTKATHEPR